jgi:triphosphoribosyl-dephospho-CoA synthase
VIEVGLPALRRTRCGGADECAAQLDALMAIMASLEDTCLLHRGGRRAVSAAQVGAREVLRLGGSATPAGRARLLELDADLMARWVSPGGAADLLAACLLLDKVTLEKSWNN